ncbi:hypothetical protein PS6_002424 [Mucor atramentarius]
MKRIYIRNTARRTFKDYKTCQDVDRVKSKIKESRKYLHRLEKANRGNQKSALKVLEEVYGRKGKTRHGLLYPYLHAHQPANKKVNDPEPFVAHVPRTAPPPTLCPPLCSLITQHLGKRLEPDLPIPPYKPLHPGRKANLLWRYRSMLLERVSVPLPFEIVCELEHKAGAPMTHPLTCSKLVTGGPRWDEFYSGLTNVVNMIRHLQPTMVSDIKAPSKLVRIQALPKSPYENQRPASLLEYLEPSVSEKDNTNIFRYTNRQIRRLYKKLLQQVPLINVIHSDQLWEQRNYTITKSQWVPQGVTKVLNDIPSSQVIETTLLSTKKKHIRRS